MWERADSSLQTRILVPTALLFGVTLGAMILAAVQFHGTDLEKVNAERADLFAGMVADGLGDVIASDDARQVTEILASVSQHRSDIEWTSVLDPFGVVRFSSRPEEIGTQPWVGEKLDNRSRIPAGHPGQLAVLRTIEVRRCKECGLRKYWLDVRFSRSAIDIAKGRLFRILVFTGAGAFVLLVAIAWWLLGREAIGPIHRLVNAMRRAQVGLPVVLADEGRPDELGVAARGFDATLEALRKSRGELEDLYDQRMQRADRFAAVGEMATGLAHEIKNPLAGLSGALELLAEDLADNPLHGEIVSEMRHQVARLTQTMESLLNFARPKPPRMQSAEVNPVLEKVLFLVTQQNAGGGTLEVVRKLGDHLPKVWADPSQLEQVFLNICLNACQAMGSGGGTLTVQTRGERGRLVVEIADTGPGIPPETRGKIFKPFFTTRKEGNGLGLSISARIVAEHGGEISFRCPPEGGTVFVVNLPVGEARESAA